MYNNKKNAKFRIAWAKKTHEKRSFKNLPVIEYDEKRLN
jgi:hypothetical protein